jgi:hypothetical protein
VDVTVIFRSWDKGGYIEKQNVVMSEKLYLDLTFKKLGAAYSSGAYILYVTCTGLGKSINVIYTIHVCRYAWEVIPGKLYRGAGQIQRRSIITAAAASEDLKSSP